MPTEQDISYAAGLFDGEGTVAMPARLAVKMTTKGPIEHLYNTFEGHFYEWGPTRTGRPVYEWRVNGPEVVPVAEALRDYALTKKRELDILLSYYKYREQHPETPQVKLLAHGQLKMNKAPNPHGLVVDFETTGLDPSVDSLLSASFMRGGRVYSAYRMPDSVDDRSLALEIRTEIEAAPYIIGWNSARFDIPFLNGRLRQHGDRPVFVGSHDDAKKMFADGRKSLEFAANTLKVTDDEVRKTPIHWPTWYAAKAGDSEAMRYIVDHAEKDVQLTRRVYDAVVMGYA